MAGQPAALKRYWAAKRGGKAKTRTRTIVKTKTRNVHHKAKRRRGHSRSGGPIKIVPLALTAAALAYVTGANGPAFVRENVAKLPGAKTFGNTATLGVACLAVDRWLKPNRYLKYAGWIGIALAAMQVGTKGSDFKWLGDGDDLGDLEGDDDDDMGGDDDMSGDDD